MKSVYVEVYLWRDENQTDGMSLDLREDYQNSDRVPVGTRSPEYRVPVGTRSPEYRVPVGTRSPEYRVPVGTRTQPLSV